MELPCSDSLNTAGLAAVFDSTAESYKFFWFGAILERIINGEETVSFFSLVNDMIAAAWYMVSEYHLSRGHDGKAHSGASGHFTPEEQ